MSSSTARWIQWSGIAALVCCVGFAVFVVVLAGNGIATAEPGTALSVLLGVTHLAAYVSMLAVLLSARASGRVAPSRSGQIAFFMMAASLMGLTAAMIGLAIPSVPELPTVVVATASFAGAHLSAPLFGIALWKTSRAGRPTAALFIAVVPVLVVVVALNILGMQVFPAYFEAVLALAFASLGYELAFGAGATRTSQEPTAAPGPT